MRTSQKPVSASAREKELLERERRGPRLEQSLLEELFRLLEQDGPWRISLDDLCGVVAHVPDLRLLIDYQIHTCDFCVRAKSHSQSLRDCARNKQAANWVVLRRRKGYAGQCHLGLTDIVEPVLVRGRVLGTLFFGSVLVRGTERLARERIQKYCRRRQFDPKPFLRELVRVPRVSRQELAVMQGRLRFAARLAGRLLEAWGFPTGNERPGLAGVIWQKDDRLPALLRRATQHVQSHFSEPLDLKRLAATLGVSADYLGGLCRTHLRETFGDYLARVRINHARRLLETGRFSAGEIAYRTGFADQAHFGKVFKRIVGLTPKRYAARKQS